MNDATPRKYRTSLLERAAEHYDFGLPGTPRSPGSRDFEAVAASAWPEDDLLADNPVEELASEVETSPFDIVDAAPEPSLRKGVDFQAGDEIVETDGAAARPPSSSGEIDRERLAERGMLVPGAGVTVLAEEFRLIKRQLLLTTRTVADGDADKARMVLVCSPAPGDGKTFCAVNLALSMATESDVEILLVDADFAKPGVMEALGLAPGPGLLDALADPQANVEEFVVATDVPKLSVLPAGTKSDSDTELLASDRARAILEALASADRRRIVIFDSPPVLAASPASVLALNVGQAMMVVRADRTSESDLRQAVQMLEACEHIQLVLNGVTFNPGGQRFGTYYGGQAAQ